MVEKNGSGINPATGEVCRYRKQFTLVAIETAPLRSEYWDGHQVGVEIAFRGEFRTGFGLSSDLNDAYQLAVENALKKR